MTTTSGAVARNPFRSRATLAALIALCALAALIRAPGLGRWGLAVDEFYFSQSTSFILDSGLPQFPGGGYYVRGIVLQYLAVAAAGWFDSRELAIRALPLLFGLLTIPIFYLVSRQHVAVFPATLCTLILVLSSWHVEFSRFGRMYSAFQFIFLVFVYFLYSGYRLGHRSHQIAAWLVALLAILFYEGSIFLPFLLALAPLQGWRLEPRRTLEVLVVTVALLALNLVMHTLSFRWIGLENPSLPDLLAGLIRGWPIFMPSLDLFWHAWSSGASTAGYLVLAGGGVYILFRQLRSTREPSFIAAVLVTVLLPLIHQFGLLASLWLVTGLIRRGALRFLVEARGTWAAWIVGSGLYWAVLAFGTRADWMPDAGLVELLKKTAIQLFLFPRVHDTVASPFAETVPLWGLLALAAIAASAVRRLSVRGRRLGEFPLACLVVCLLLLGVVRTPYTSTRYSFFVFPLVLIVAHVEIAALMRWCKGRLGPIPWRATALIPLALFCVTEDFHPGHLLDVSSKQANFRMGPYRRFASHWYDRQDFRSPAEFVNGVYEPEDAVVIDYAPTSAYLEAPYVYYLPTTMTRFPGVSRKAGTEEAWTGRPLISDPSALLDRVPEDPTGSLWLIAVRHGGGGGVRNLRGLAREAAGRGITLTEEFAGIDESVGVWRLGRRAGWP